MNIHSQARLGTYQASKSRNGLTVHKEENEMYSKTVIHEL